MTAPSDALTPVPLFFDGELFRVGKKVFVNWDLGSTQRMVLIGGGTGGGKTTHLFYCLTRIWKHFPPTSRLYLMDFKGLDYSFLEDVPGARYYPRDKFSDGLLAYNAEISDRLNGKSKDRSPLIAVVEEYGSFISYISILDRKLTAECHAAFAQCLFLSRAAGGIILCSTQRPDQSIMPSGGARDQFGVRVWWGRFASSDAMTMMFGDMKDQIPENYNERATVGRGIAFLDGKGLYEVVAPRLPDDEIAKKAIIDLCTR